MYHDGICGGPVTGITVPLGYDDHGPLPDELVLICHRCGSQISDSEAREDDE